MGDSYDHTKKAWVKQENQGSVQQKPLCICWLSECTCQFQRHTKSFVLCDDHEIFQKCLNHEDINYGDD